MTKSFLFMIRSQPVPGREQEFTTYYDEKHIADLLAVPGIVSARRYQVQSADAEWGGTSLGLYEIEADDVATVMADMGSRYGTDAMPRSDAVDSRRTLFLTAVEVTPLRRADDIDRS